MVSNPISLILITQKRGGYGGGAHSSGESSTVAARLPQKWTNRLALDRVEEEVTALAECCDKVECVISEELKEIGWNRRIRLDPVLLCGVVLIAKACESAIAVRVFGDIISTTERLKHELEVTTQRREIASCFLRDYQLSNEEIHALREEDLSENFFKALSHVQEIHANCKILLMTHHQRAGLELMDMMAVYQEGAYERLCKINVLSSHVVNKLVVAIGGATALAAGVYTTSILKVMYRTESYFVIVNNEYGEQTEEELLPGGRTFSVALSVGGWFFDRVGVSAIDCPYPSNLASFDQHCPVAVVDQWDMFAAVATHEEVAVVAVVVMAEIGLLHPWSS
ncbi:hypothetical protein Syun_013851 [Stephania yunnanensis]|uniref:Uncharacterized protein n=1 Tax=Stephania yunnanensis TaxID=152371 RepID=A0AAP0JJ98_9MAGN